MKYNNKTGFSIMELTITTIMISVILVIAPVVILKKAVKPKTNVEEKLYVALCEDKCVYIAKNSILIKSNKEKSEKYNYVRHSGRLYEIQIFGGGGGSTKNSPGGGGEFKSIKMHSLDPNGYSSKDGSSIKEYLTGYYLLEAGKGGGEGKSGEPSKFCIITEKMAQKAEEKGVNTISCKDDGAIIIAQAMGGITSNEPASDFVEQGNGEKTDNAFRTTNCAFGKYGWGGCKKEKSNCKNKEGQNGVVVIK